MSSEASLPVSIEQRTGIITLSLLGRCLVRADRTQPTPIPISSQKGLALLAYLAMQPDHSESREQLATLLWGNRVDSHARHSLRQCLLKLREDLTPFAPNLMVVGQKYIQLQASMLTVDAKQFVALAKSNTAAELKEAANLYGGRFLGEFHIDVDRFEDWASTQNECLKTAATRVFENITALSDAYGHGHDALMAVDRLIALDPRREDWQRIALRIYARYRSRESALEYAKKFTARLKADLDAEPEAATLTLIEEIAVSAMRDGSSPAISITEGAAARFLTSGKSNYHVSAAPTGSLSSIPAYPDEQPIERAILQRETVAGEPVLLAQYASFEATCKNVGFPMINILRPPAHGIITTRPEPQIVGGWRVRATNCIGTSLMGLAIYYWPQVTYQGTDEMTLAIFFPATGRRFEDEIKVTVLPQ